MHCKKKKRERYITYLTNMRIKRMQSYTEVETYFDLLKRIVHSSKKEKKEKGASLVIRSRNWRLANRKFLIQT